MKRSSAYDNPRNHGYCNSEMPDVRVCIIHYIYVQRLLQKNGCFNLLLSSFDDYPKCWLVASYSVLIRQIGSYN